MASKKDTVQITFRAPASVVAQLDEICRMSGMKRSEFIVSAITSEYDKINGNPQMKKMLEQMRQIADAMKQMTGQADAGMPVGIGAGTGGDGEA